MNSDTLVVYTALYGEGFELPNAIPSTGVDYICFTDRKNLISDVWQIIEVEPSVPGDLPRSSREQKIRPHLWLSDYSQSLYIDTRVELLKDPWDAWNTLMGDSGLTIFGAFSHLNRATVYAEIDMIRHLGLDSSEVLNRTISFLEETNPSALWLKPVWGGMLARRHNAPRCIKVMENWHDLVMRYSRRDQITLPGILANLLPSDLNLVKTGVRISNFHRWPTHENRPSR